MRIRSNLKTLVTIEQFLGFSYLLITFQTSSHNFFFQENGFAAITMINNYKNANSKDEFPKTQH